MEAEFPKNSRRHAPQPKHQRRLSPGLFRGWAKLKLEVVIYTNQRNKDSAFPQLQDKQFQPQVSLVLPLGGEYGDRYDL